MADLLDKPSKFTLENNTAKRVVINNPKNKLEVEIGDVMQPDFKPQVKIKRWENEVNFSMRAPEDPDATIVVEEDKLKYKAKDYEVHHYEDDNGLNFEMVLLKKPATNSFTFTIQTKGLVFKPQPALTQGEIDQGAFRPENAVDSIAIYHATKGGMNDAAGMEYQAGKFGHLYRSEAVDADGNKIYGTQAVNVDAGTLTKTFSDTWLANAKYPVTIK